MPGLGNVLMSLNYPEKPHLGPSIGTPFKFHPATFNSNLCHARGEPASDAFLGLWLVPWLSLADLGASVLLGPPAHSITEGAPVPSSPGSPAQGTALLSWLWQHKHAAALEGLSGDSLWIYLLTVERKVQLLLQTIILMCFIVHGNKKKNSVCKYEVSSSVTALVL